MTDKGNAAVVSGGATKTTRYDYPQSTPRCPDPSRDAAAIVEALACGKHGCQCAASARRGSGLTHCPAHIDPNPSLSVGEEDGKVLYCCQATCSQEAVTAALRERGLWPQAKGVSSPRSQPTTKRIVDTYPYHDEAGCLLFEAVRYEPKGFSQRRPNGNGGHVYSLDGVRRVLYRLPQLLAADPTELVYIVEGEKHADRLIGLGFVSTTSPMGAGKWLAEYNDALVGRRVVVLPDNDGPGRAHAQEVAASLYGVAAEFRVLTLPGLVEHGDVLNWLAAGGDADGLRALAESAPVWEPEPIPDGAALLDEVVAHIQSHVKVISYQADTSALWALHTHAFDAAETTPYLHITSPEKQSGKTVLLQVLESIVARPWFTGSVSAAVLRRKIDKVTPTLLLDESDAAFKGVPEYAEELRATLNTGYRRGGKATLCVKGGGDYEPKDFFTFCPKAIAGIGRLPDTVEDRSILIAMKRMARNETVQRWRERAGRLAGEPIRKKLEAWAQAHLSELEDARPDLPDELTSRQQDCWEPLFAIADAVQAGWPQRARLAALRLSHAAEDQSENALLLEHCRIVYQEGGDPDFLPTTALLSILKGREEWPWTEAFKGKGLTSVRLAKILRNYETGDNKDSKIIPRQHRTEAGLERGYYRQDFLDAWSRYLSLPPDQPVTPVTTGICDPKSVSVEAKNPVTGSGLQGVTEPPCNLQPVTENQAQFVSESVADAPDVTGVTTTKGVCVEGSEELPPSTPIYAESKPPPQMAFSETGTKTAPETPLKEAPGGGERTLDYTPTPLLQHAVALGLKVVSVKRAEPQPVPKTAEPADVCCPVCGSADWWMRPDGSGPVCGVCHPNPEVLVEAWQRERGEQ